MGKWSRKKLWLKKHVSKLFVYFHIFLFIRLFSLDLRRDFVTPPYSAQIQLGYQGELRCHPPVAQPEARVDHWLKNGEKIDADSNPNYIQSSSGSLLFTQAQLEDTANYTCVASNGIFQRKSPPAKVTVYGKKNLQIYMKRI